MSISCSNVVPYTLLVLQGEFIPLRYYMLPRFARFGEEDEVAVGHEHVSWFKKEN